MNAATVVQTVRLVLHRACGKRFWERRHLVCNLYERGDDILLGTHTHTQQCMLEKEKTWLCARQRMPMKGHGEAMSLLIIIGLTCSGIN